MGWVGPHVQGIGESNSAHGCVVGRDERRYRSGIWTLSVLDRRRCYLNTRHLRIQAQYQIAPADAGIRIYSRMVEGEIYVVPLRFREEGLTTNNRIVVQMKTRFLVDTVSVVKGLWTWTAALQPIGFGRHLTGLPGMNFVPS